MLFGTVNNKIVLAAIVLHNSSRTDIHSNAGTQDEKTTMIGIDDNQSDFSRLAPNRNRSSGKAFSARRTERKQSGGGVGLIRATTSQSFCKKFRFPASTNDSYSM